MSIANVELTNTIHATATSERQLVIGPELIESGQYFVSKLSNGTIVATPKSAIPEDELALWENPHLRASVAQGIQEAFAGKLTELLEIFDNNTNE